MKRKTCLKTTAIVVVCTAIAPLRAYRQEKKEIITKAKTVRKKWAGNYAYKAQNLFEPKTVEEVQVLVKKLRNRKAHSRHCFKNIADSPLIMISTKDLKGFSVLTTGQ